MSKRFGALQALRDVTCELDGRAVGLLGPNGAGKTTLMRACLGLLTPDAGEVRVLGIDARRDPGAVRMRLGYAAEGPHRIPGLSGLESVAYAGELCGLSRRTALLRAHEILDLVGLDEARQRPVEEYSTGMHQRVKLGMALVHDPELLMLDEPTSGLDPGNRDELLQLLVRLREGDGPAVLLSTHLLHDVERVCDTCIIMDRGQVRYAGSLEQLRARMGDDEHVLRGEGDLAGLASALAQAGHAVAPGERPDALRVRLIPGHGPEAIWRAAQAVGASLWQVQRRGQRLEDAFMAAIDGGGAEHRGEERARS
ncbi:ABC transporter ATP-binding protein [Paraliomyxa miuraensis]|uniref:ABC transporter ATP-binding protein n=1 Tax=Paraliomyxa miuraensis TaxID=376150 RepID=UPI00224C84D7|nr:ABC transporter ATP-binding protein [Paraliomyxa miuraensis]MCX4242564.1 ABC transporter ATP-binding protein [Paraliomyxa miuraensis]